MSGGRCRSDLDSYEKAYSLSPSHALVFNRARAHQRLSQFPKARELFEAFARDAPAELRATVPKLEELLTEVRSKVSTLIIHSTVNGAWVIDGQQTGDRPDAPRSRQGQRRRRRTSRAPQSGDTQLGRASRTLRLGFIDRRLVVYCLHPSQTTSHLARPGRPALMLLRTRTAPRVRFRTSMPSVDLTVFVMVKSPLLGPTAAPDG